MAWSKVLIGVALIGIARGEQARVEPAKIEQILQQLHQLQQDNRKLTQAMEDLRREVEEMRSAKAAATAPEHVPEHMDEKLDALNQRVADLDTGKMEAGGRFPLRLSGVALMNTYLYAGKTGGVDLPLVAAIGPGQQSAGATFRNTEIGLQYFGSQGIFGAQAAGNLQLDLFGGTLNSQNNLARIRTADISLNWERRSLTFALDKPILSPRNPDSLSQLGVPVLANSGNLWLWQPQLRYEERIPFGESAGLNARLGVYQTSEALAGLPASVRFSPSRPALQGRFEFFRDFGNGRRLEFAPGFHVSRSLAAGESAQSWAASADWLIPLAPSVDWTGFAFTGQDLSGLGIGGLHQGLIVRNGRLLPVRTRGGWTQLTWHATRWLDWNLIAGLNADVGRDLPANGVSRNFTYLTNLRFRLAPNLVAGPELMQIRTNYRESGILRVNRYDLALGYFF
jgi:hypothetical protein